MAYFKMYSKKTINGGDFVMDKKFIGTFELTDKNVIISDPFIGYAKLFPRKR